MILIADSGSTKTDWGLVDEGKFVKTVRTKGMNPFFQTSEAIAQEIASALLPEIDPNAIRQVCFYGAGCIPEKQPVVKNGIASHFPSAEVQVDSDLLGAARGVCGRRAGIVCILGTGSNSCFFDGEQIVSNVSPLGFILGDEGSGAVLGKLLVGDLLKNQLREGLKEEFLRQFNLTVPEIIDRVYRQPFPNRFLAGLSPFLFRNIQEPGIRALVERSFRDFFQRNVMQYPYQDYPVSLVGSVAYHYRDILIAVARQCEIRIETIVKEPMEGLIAYHSEF